MKVAIFSTKKYDRQFLDAANGSLHKLRFFEPHLNEETVGLATGFEAVCVFVNDHVDAAVIARLRSLGVRLIALRCAGWLVLRPDRTNGPFNAANFSRGHVIGRV